MSRLIKTIQWVGIVPSILFILFSVFIWFITGFNEIFFYIGLLVLLLLIYGATQIFAYEIFSHGENKLPLNKEILSLEKEEISMQWTLINTIGLGFLIPGLFEFPNNKYFLLIGVGFLALGNLWYNLLYLPRQRFLLRKEHPDLRKY